MSKDETRVPFSWNTLIHNFNTGTVKTHDVLASREDFIKKLKFFIKEEAEAGLKKLIEEKWNG
jgi:hypothetical protein